MKTSTEAITHDRILAIRSRQYNPYESIELMNADIEKVHELLWPMHPTLRQSPFIEAAFNVGNQLESKDPQKFDFRLVDSCRSFLSMTPIDEIAPASINILATISAENLPENERSRVAAVITDVFIRSRDLDSDDMNKIRRACIQSVEMLREKGFFTPENEQSISHSLSRENGIDLVKKLGFDMRNIRSMKNMNPRHIQDNSIQAQR